jgi:hypothetical protein
LTKKVLLFLCIFILLFQNVGCKNSIEDQQYSDKIDFKRKIISTANRDLMPGTENLKGVRYRIYNDKGIIDNKYSYILKKGETWDKFISITHNFDEPAEYKLLFFIDYKQSNAVIDGKTLRDFNFKLNPNQTIEIPVSLDKLSEGLNDILFIIVGNPNNNLLENNPQDNVLKGQIMCYFRFNILLGNTVVKPKYKLTTVAEKDISHEFKGIIINQSSSEIEQPTLFKISSSKNIPFFNHIPNKSDKLKNYAIINLLNWQQINFGKSYINFFSVDKNKEGVVPLNIDIPDNNKYSTLVSIAVPNPYEPIDKDNKLVLNSRRDYINMENKK